jgi:hypothetical protein
MNKFVAVRQAAKLARLTHFPHGPKKPTVSNTCKKAIVTVRELGMAEHPVTIKYVDFPQTMHSDDARSADPVAAAKQREDADRIRIINESKAAREARRRKALDAQKIN